MVRGRVPRRHRLHAQRRTRDRGGPRPAGPCGMARRKRAQYFAAMARDRRLPKRGWRPSSGVRKPARAGQPRPLAARTPPCAAARSGRRRRLWPVPRGSAEPTGVASRSRRACVHELPCGAGRRPRLRYVSWERSARVSAARSLLLPCGAGRSSARGTRRAERVALRGPSVLHVSSDAGHRHARRSPCERVGRRLVRLRDRRTRGSVRGERPPLHRHLPRTWRCASLADVERGTNDVQRLPWFSATRSLPRRMHELPSRGRRRGNPPRVALAPPERQGRPRRRQWALRCVPRKRRRSVADDRRALGACEPGERAGRAVLDVPRASRRKTPPRRRRDGEARGSRGAWWSTRDLRSDDEDVRRHLLPCGRLGPGAAVDGSRTVDLHVVSRGAARSAARAGDELQCELLSRGPNGQRNAHARRAPGARRRRDRSRAALISAQR